MLLTKPLIIMNHTKKFEPKQSVLSALSQFPCAVTVPEIIRLANSNGQPKLSKPETEALLEKMTLSGETKRLPVNRYRCHHIWEGLSAEPASAACKPRHGTANQDQARCSRCGRVTIFEEVENLEREEIYYFLRAQKEYVPDVAIAGELGLKMPQVKKYLEELGDKVETDGDGNWRSILVVPVEVVKDEIVKQEESERDKLLRLEDELQQIEQKYFMDAGERYVNIIDMQLYKEVGYDNFKEYCTERLGKSHSRVRQLVDAYRLVKELEAERNKKNTNIEVHHGGLLSSTTNVEVNDRSPLPLPTNERQCRELLKLKTPEERAALWFREVKARKDGKIPARKIKELVEQRKKVEKEARYNSQVERFKVGDVVRITAKYNTELKPYHYHWGIVERVTEFGYEVITYRGRIKEVLHDDLTQIKQASKTATTSLLNQMQKLLKSHGSDSDFAAYLHFIGTKPVPGASKVTSEIFEFLTNSHE